MSTSNLPSVLYLRPPRRQSETTPRTSSGSSTSKSFTPVGPILLRPQENPAEDRSRPLVNPGRPSSSVASHPQVASGRPREFPPSRSGRPSFAATHASLVGSKKGPACPSQRWNGADNSGRRKAHTAPAQPSGGLGHLNIEVGHSVSMGYRSLTCPLVLVLICPKHY